MTMAKAGVIGWPIEHSKSPRLHGYWLKTHSISGTYDRVATKPEEFEATVRDLISQGWKGANVTIPHKETALKIADEQSPRAQAIGAANTLVFRPDGTIFADNTDGFGFIANLRDRAGAAWAADQPAVVFGAGGAARAILYSLLEEGAPEIRLLNRTRARAEALQSAFGSKVTVLDWGQEAAALPGAGLIVNTTSLGMEGQPPFHLDLATCPKSAVATDIVYTPLETPFLKAAAAEGLTTVDGLGMLIHQGRPGFAAWFGPMPETDDDLRRLMLQK